MTHPLVSILRRYVVDYTNGHDVSVVPQLIDRSYRFAMSGSTLDYDGYVAMVSGAFDQFPDIELVVHDLFTNGERLAMRFTEHGSSVAHDGRHASWSGISMYRWNGTDVLTECLVEQDFYGRREQLASGEPRAVPPPMRDPWGIHPEEPDPHAEECLASWLRAHPNLGSDLVVRNGLAARDAPPIPIETDDVEVEDSFSGGYRVAFRLRLRGRYIGGLHGIPDSRVGAPVWMNVTGIARVDGDEITEAHVVTDRYGLRGRLRA